MKLPTKHIWTHRHKLLPLLGALLGAFTTYIFYERQTLLMITDSDAETMAVNNTRGTYETKYGTIFVSMTK